MPREGWTPKQSEPVDVGETLFKLVGILAEIDKDCFDRGEESVIDWSKVKDADRDIMNALFLTCR